MEMLVCFYESEHGWKKKPPCDLSGDYADVFMAMIRKADWAKMEKIKNMFERIYGDSWIGSLVPMDKPLHVHFLDLAMVG